MIGIVFAHNIDYYVLSVHAKCIIFVGGGTFQRHAKFLYEKLHPKEKCVYILKECSKSFKLNRKKMIYKSFVR